MRSFIRDMKVVWLDMVVPPWRKARPDEDWFGHLSVWLIGWGWTLAGLILGAVYAPLILRWARLMNTPYQDTLLIGIALLAGFIVQFVGWVLSTIAVIPFESTLVQNAPALVRLPAEFLLILPFLLVESSPFIGLAYGIGRYFELVGLGQRSATIAFVGGLLIKTFAIPLIKGIVTGALFRWFMKWLRGGKDTKKAV